MDNTIDFIQHILAKNQKTSAVHLICDDECLSTTELLNSILKYSGVRKFLIPIPEFVLKFILSFCKLQRLEAKILGDFEIDNVDVKNDTGWTPRHRGSNA